MNLYISKLIRKVNKVKTPSICYANLYLPYSMNEICDCKDSCKFNPPSGNLFIKHELYKNKIDYIY